MSLYAAVTAYDNSGEETPFFNDKAIAYGFVITLLALTWSTNLGCLMLFNVGLGQHFVDLGVDGMSDFVKMFYWVNANYNMSMTAIKLSILFQYLRVLADHAEAGTREPRILRLAVIVLIVATSAWGFIFSLLAWVPCIPISADWTFSNNTATRYGYGSDDKDTFALTFMMHGATNMTLDIAVFCVPLFSRSMWASAGRQRQSRIAMVLLYCLGIISVICSIFRFTSIVDHEATTSPAFDPTWYGPEAFILSVLEVDIATIVASLPVFWPYLRRNIDRIMVTHEIEVKVTENFTQIDDQTDDLGKLSGRHSDGRRSEQNAYAPWEDSEGASTSGGGGGGGGLKLKSETMMMMRSLSRRTRTRTTDEESGEIDLQDLPYDGSQSPTPRTPRRVAFTTRESNEVLLR
ncbi:unnamed protein product [Discula destructiva]